MVNVDVGGADRLALAVVVQYRMATTEQMHLIVSPGVRIEQTRRRLAKLREEGLVDRITLPQAGRTRVWFATQYGVEVASEWPELREWRPPRLVSDRTAARLRVGHALVVTETGLAFLQDARRRGDVCRPLDWIPEVYHSLGNGEAVIPDALLYYRTSESGGDEDGRGVMRRAFVEVDRATMGPERLAAKLTAYARLHSYAPVQLGRPRAHRQPVVEENWRRRYAMFPRLLFVLDGTGPAGIAARMKALHAAVEFAVLRGLLRSTPVMVAALPDILRDGPSAPVWRPVEDLSQRMSWMDAYRPPAAPTRLTAPEPERSWPTPSWGTSG
ncbi:replication-relaxation family protein [Streptomyces pseudovenezuelae]|uniref:replication-relaxation family protein n=1 Tax=Streptomyces pseudovenezuelae TaxID=67350 RepID=UPI002E805D78|nr:replication-relaxation family protein [Streptomyces pseudovenezuelae]WUA85789.1 replication-relaxation family protein [Streptomyces pseudovenezuelae]WUA93977.1 replication-relaxation family protein [Streptomyces pseudovenezuelae]